MSDPDQVVTWGAFERQIRRQDALEGQFYRLERERLRAMQGDIAANRRTLERLIAAKESSGGQPDWIGNTDPEKARTMLADTWEWVENIGRPLGLSPQVCWPWHTGAVAALLAGATHYRAVHEDDNAVAVTDFHTRYLDAIEKRVKVSTAECDNHRHKVGEAYYSADVDPDRLPVLAAWYAAGAEGLPPGLGPWLEAVR